MTSITAITETLKAHDEPFSVLALQNGYQLLVTQRGGRVLGVFGDDVVGGLFWLNDAVEDIDSYHAFIQSGNWNLGGERIWIAPEIQYNCTDRTRFTHTLSIPPAIDPGTYKLSESSQGIMLEQTLTLEAHNLQHGQKSLTIKRMLSPTENPLRSLSNYEQLMQAVDYAGYVQKVTLSENNTTPILSEAWNLIQLNAGGTLIVPVNGSLYSSHYVGSKPDEAYHVKNGAVRIPITGNLQYKVGYKAVSMTGRLGYLHHLSDGQSYLLIRSFYNDPSATYTEEPPHETGNNGHSVHIYNDDGKLGGFGEMECNGRAIGGETGRSSSTDEFTLWAFVGKPGQLRPIAEQLLGVML